MQSCSTTKVIATTVPGRELSRTTLGEREIDNRVIMDEIDPFSVKLYRLVSTVEFAKIEYQAVTETRHEKTTYDCRDAYDRYPAFLLTTLAVPVLYEMVTGFDILRRMCEKNPPTYVTETAETGQTLTRESFDKEKVVTIATPLAGESVVVEIDGKKFVSTTSATGIATFPEKEIAVLINSDKSLIADYQYKDVRLATSFKKRDPQKESVTSKSSVGAKSLWEEASDEPSESEESDSADATPEENISGPQIKPDPIRMIGEEHNAPVISAQDSMKPGQKIPPAVAVSAGMTAGSGTKGSVAIPSGIDPDSSISGEWKFILNIKFGTNKAVIMKKYYPRLKAVADTLIENPGLTGVIEGHTDNVGSKELNQKISLRRAEAVAQHLIRNFGIAPERLRVEGYGMSRPIADNTTPKGRGINRRIEAKFKSTE